MENAGSIFCFTKDGNTSLNLNSSNFQLSGSYSNPVKCICDIEMDSTGCDGACGIRVHLPTMILSLWAEFLQPVQLGLAMGMLLLKLSLEFKMPQSCWHNTASHGHVSAQQAVGIPPLCLEILVLDKK